MIGFLFLATNNDSVVYGLLLFIFLVVRKRKRNLVKKIGICKHLFIMQDAIIQCNKVHIIVSRSVSMVVIMLIML